MKSYAFPVEGQILVILEQELDDMLDEMDQEYRCGSSNAVQVDIDDPRLTTEAHQINPEADAFEPLVTMSIHW